MLHSPAMHNHPFLFREELLCGGFSIHLCLSANNSLSWNTASPNP